MANRLTLHELLCSILESRNVYYQPPSTLEMEYPAIRYELDTIDNQYSNNNTYIQTTKYLITVIDRSPVGEIYKKISKLPRCRFDRFYVSDNLNHYVFLITY